MRTYRLADTEIVVFVALAITLIVVAALVFGGGTGHFDIPYPNGEMNYLPF